ncbi:MAG: TetR/AcrR family transcriptional regulator, partial [Nocardiopsaceae bacterium]|nr:TetR/AcrR family transcriptional regulator [Nocardiopsaceae bacterium]
MDVKGTTHNPDSDAGGEPQADTQIPPPPWQRLPDRKTRRRREPISRDAIVAAAVRLLDREGLAALSMRRLAEELGTGAASLYWHVGSKDGLLDLVLDQLIGEQHVPEPDSEHWKDQLKDVARTQRRISLRHPYIVRISIGRIPMGPNALRYSERVLGILRAGGLPPRLAVHGYLLLIATVNGFTV